MRYYEKYLNVRHSSCFDQQIVKTVLTFVSHQIICWRRKLCQYFVSHLIVLCQCFARYLLELCYYFANTLLLSCQFFASMYFVSTLLFRCLYFACTLLVLCQYFPSKLLLISLASRLLVKGVVKKRGVLNFITLALISSKKVKDTHVFC